MPTILSVKQQPDVAGGRPESSAFQSYQTDPAMDAKGCLFAILFVVVVVVVVVVSCC